MAERLPAEVFPPGEYVADELDARGWTRGDLAEILGKSASNVHDIISGKVNISPETARGLADAFGTSAEVWLSLDSRYRLRDAQASPGTNLRAKIYSKTPVRELLKRNWIEGSTNPEVLASRVCDFLGVTSLDEAPRPLAHAARKSTTYAKSSPSQIAWLCQVGRLAPAAPITGPFRAAAFTPLMEELRALVPNPNDIRQVPNILGKYGIRLLIVEHLSHSKIDGICYWLNKTSPVIVLTLRYGRLDSFWHTLFHELAHVAHGDGRNEAVIDDDLSFFGLSLGAAEEAATRFAVEALIPRDQLMGFIERVGPMYSLRTIQGFASRIGVHPAIVIGQLAHRGEIPWSKFGTHLVNVREHVTSTAFTDGWGHAVPSFTNLAG